MSHNHSRAEKSEPHPRRPGRSGNSSSGNHHRGFNSGGGRGSGGYAHPGQPHSSSVGLNSNQFSGNRSYKKLGNVQGGQYRVNPPNTTTNTQVGGGTPAHSGRAMQNGVNPQPPHVSEASASSGAKPVDTSSSKTLRPIPRPPNPQTSEGVTKPSHLQFGSLNPDSVNSMPIPVRTTSAPPNLNEQKHEQVHHGLLKTGPVLPMNTGTKQKQEKSHHSPHANAVNSLNPPHAKKESHAPISVHSAANAHKSSSTATPWMQLFEQPHGSIQFTPSPQIQSRSCVAPQLQIPMNPIPPPVGNPPQSQQQMYYNTSQSHVMQPSGMMHQGHGMTYAQIAHQMPSQINMGMGIAPQYSQQQVGKFGGIPFRRIVKITDPETHEEVKLAQTAPSFPTQQPKYYPQLQTGSYGPGSTYYKVSSSLSSTSTQAATGSQASRINHPINPTGHTVSIANPSTPNALPGRKSGPPSYAISQPSNLVHSENGPSLPVSVSLDTVQLTVKSADIVSSEKSGTHSKKTALPAFNNDAVKIAKSIKETPSPLPQKATEANMDDSTQLLKSVPEPLDNSKFPITDSDKHHTAMSSVVSLRTTKSDDSLSAVPSQVVIVEPVASSTENKKDSAKRSNSFKNRQKKPNRKDIKHPQQQASENFDLSQIDSRMSKTSEVGPSENKDTIVAPPSSSSSPKHLAISEASGATKDVHVGFSIAGVLSTDVVSPEKPLHYVARELTKLAEICKPAKTCDTSGDSCGNKLADPFQGTNNSKQEDSVASETLEKNAIGDSIESGHKLMDPKEDGASSISEDDHACQRDRLLLTDSGRLLTSKTDISLASKFSSVTKKLEERPADVLSGAPASNPQAEMACMKTTSKKMKRKDIISKADAAGTNSDLYMAYKGPEEKVDAVVTSKSVDSSSVVDTVHASGDDSKKEDVRNEDDTASKAEVDDWEDVVDMNSQHGSVSKKLDECGFTSKKYSRDFLLTFSDQCIDLPAAFDTEFDKDLMIFRVGVSNPDRRPFSNSGRIIDRPSSSGRADRRMVGALNEDKWNKAPNAYGSIRDIPHDINYGPPGIGFHSGPGANHGVLRNPRGQSNQYVGGILSGPMHSPVHGGMSRGNYETDRWQRASGIQRGLIPSPQTPLQVMHKAEKKYEVGKTSDKEDIKQRQLKAILNKLTPQNFDRLFEQVKEVNIDSAVTLTGVISQIFDKALMEPTFCEMYADFCLHLSGALPDFNEDNEKITFKRLLLNKCQEEFETGEKEEAEANNVEEEGEMKCTKEEREEKKLQARRRMLGNIRLIGELYKKRMLTERIMHECIKKLIGQDQNPDEEDIEALCKLMSTIGVMIDHYKSKDHIDAYFDIMSKLSNNQKLSSRLRFMLKDSIDLRKNKWQQRRKVEGPKKIDEVHRDAVQERQAQTSRLARGPMGSSGRRGLPVEYGPRASTFSPSLARSFQPQARAFGGQDVRLGDRHPSEGRTLSVPLPQRPTNDDSITLVPQGGLARGMSNRGQPLMPTSADRSNSQEQNQYSGNRDSRNADRVSDRPLSSITTVHRQESFAGTQNYEANLLSKDLLLKKSISTIKEYYSAKDENEVVLCIKELKSPTFYPSMVSLWVADSFERKDIERDLLSKLIIYLCKDTSLISHAYLIQGFESVLSTLEDAVNDAPKAPEFLGRMFANMISENVISLNEVGRLVREGGEEVGSLIEAGLAADVVGSTLQNVKIDQGDSGLNETISGSSLNLVDFKAPQASTSRKLLDPFL